MDKRNLKHSVNFQPEDREILKESVKHNGIMTFFLMALLTLPLIAITFILTMAIQATAGLLIHIPGSVFFLLFVVLFSTTVWALISTLREDEDYIDGEPDIIHELFGYSELEQTRQEILSQPPVQNPLTTCEGGNLSHWLILVQKYFTPAQDTYTVLEESRVYTKELRKANYKMNKALGMQFIELLKSYDSLATLPLKTEELNQTLRKMENSFVLIRDALSRMYTDHLKSRIFEADILIVTLRNDLSSRGYSTGKKQEK